MRCWGGKIQKQLVRSLKFALSKSLYYGVVTQHPNGGWVAWQRTGYNVLLP